MKKKPVGSARSFRIELRNYWYEQITKREAMRRLATRNLDKKRRSRIERTIPENMDHFITMNDGFREFVSLDGAPAVLLLALPTIRMDKKTVQLAAPMIRALRNANGEIEYFSRFELHEFKFSGSTLMEQGVPRESFKFRSCKCGRSYCSGSHFQDTPSGNTVLR